MPSPLVGSSLPAGRLVAAAPPPSPPRHVVAEALAGQDGEGADEIAVEPCRIRLRTQSSDERSDGRGVGLSNPGDGPRRCRWRLEILLRPIGSRAPWTREQLDGNTTVAVERDRP